MESCTDLKFEVKQELDPLDFKEIKREAQGLKDEQEDFSYLSFSQSSVCIKEETDIPQEVQDETTYLNTSSPCGDAVCKITSSECQKTSPNESNLETDSSSQPFTCTVCEKTFSSKADLVRHFLFYNCQTEYTCSVCDKKFSFRSALVRHSDTHTGESPYSCSMCDRLFTHKSSLVRHSRSHTGDFPFSCSVCNKKFNLKADLVKHSSIIGCELPLSCPVCNRKFRNLSGLVRHTRTHKVASPSS